MNAIFIALSVAATFIMVYAWYRVIRLRKKIPGGVVKSSSNILAEFIGLFTAGFFALPLFPFLTQISRDIIVGVLLLFASIFVVIVINLFDLIASDVGL